MENQNSTVSYYHNLVSIFNSTDILNLILVDYNGGAADTTFGSSVLLPSGTTQINLNLNTLSDCSSEFIASTIIHEMIHSYLATHPMNWDTTLTDHQYMVRDLLDEMAESLMAIFPLLPEYDAYCMAYVGFGQKEDDPIQQQNLQKFLKMAKDEIADKFNVLNEANIIEIGYGYTHKGNTGTRSGSCQ